MALFLTSTTFWGAVLNWGVSLEGEAYCDLSVDDAALIWGLELIKR